MPSYFAIDRPVRQLGKFSVFPKDSANALEQVRRETAGSPARGRLLFAGLRFARGSFETNYRAGVAAMLTFVIQKEGFFQPDGIFYRLFTL